MPGSCTPSRMRESAGGGRHGQVRYGNHGRDALRRYGLADLIEDGGGYQVEGAGPLELRRKIRLRFSSGGGDEAGVEGCADGQCVLYEARSFEQAETVGLAVAAAVQPGRQFDLWIAGAGDLFHRRTGAQALRGELRRRHGGTGAYRMPAPERSDKKSRDVCLCNLYSALWDGRAAVCDNAFKR